MSDYKLIIQRIGLIGFVNLVVSLSSLVLLPILTKNLSLEDYSVWAQIQVTIGFFVPLATLGLASASDVFLAGEKEKENISKGFFSIFTIICFTSFVLSILFFLFSKPLAIAIFGGSGADNFVKLASLLIFLGGINAAMDMFFATFQKIKIRSTLIFSETILQMILIISVLFAGFGLNGAIISLIFVKIVLYIIKFTLVNRQIKMCTPSIMLMRDYLTFSMPLIPAILSTWTYNLSDRYIIGYFLDIGNVGIYSASYGLGNMVSLFYAPISIVFLPALSKLYRNNKNGEIISHFNNLSKLYLMLAIPAMFGLSVLSKKLLITLTTSDFIDGFIVIPIIAIGTILFNYGSINANILILYKQTKKFALITIFSAIINIILNIILVPMIGIVGAALATLMTFAFYFIMNGMLSFKLLNLNIDLKFIFKSIISSVVMSYCILLLDPIGAIDIIISIGVGAIIYSIMLITLKGFTREEYVFFKSFF